MLIRIRNGLLEAENFYKNATVGNLVGNIAWHRAEDKFYLDTNDKIERFFSHESFYIYLEKELQNPNNIKENDTFIFYVGSDNSNNEYGIQEDFSTGFYKYNKIIFYNRILQLSISNDNINWDTIGGINLTDSNELINRQGFRKNTVSPMVLNNYQVYRSPYVSLIGYSSGLILKIYKKNLEDETKEDLYTYNVFNEQGEADFFLEFPNEFRMEVYDAENDNVIFSSGYLLIYPGDRFIDSEYNLEYIYDDRTLPHEEITAFESINNKIQIKNVSNETYTNLIIYGTTPNNDLVKLSLNPDALYFQYTDKIEISSLSPNEIIDLYVFIDRKTASTDSVYTNEFDIRVTSSSSEIDPSNPDIIDLNNLTDRVYNESNNVKTYIDNLNTEVDKLLNK